jgi:hypothetical protein
MFFTYSYIFILVDTSIKFIITLHNMQKEEKTI